MTGVQTCALPIYAKDVGEVVDGIRGRGRPRHILLRWICLGGCVKLRDMKKQASDQSFHDRRYQERKRAEAAKKPVRKKVVGGESAQAGQAAKQDSSEPGTAK